MNITTSTIKTSRRPEIQVELWNDDSYAAFYVKLEWNAAGEYLAPAMETLETEKENDIWVSDLEALIQSELDKLPSAEHEKLCEELAEWMRD